MKTISIKFLSIICLFLLTTSVFSQEDNDEFEIEELTGTFKGYDKNLEHFIFSVIIEDEDGVEGDEDYEFIITDKKIEAKFDFNSKTLVGQSFIIKYIAKVISELNSDGEEEFHEIYTIKDLLLIKS